MCLKERYEPLPIKRCLEARLWAIHLRSTYKLDYEHLPIRGALKLDYQHLIIRGAWKLDYEHIPTRGAWKPDYENLPIRNAWKLDFEHLPIRSVCKCQEAKLWALTHQRCLEASHIVWSKVPHSADDRIRQHIIKQVAGALAPDKFRISPDGRWGTDVGKYWGGGHGGHRARSSYIGWNVVELEQGQIHWCWIQTTGLC